MSAWSKVHHSVMPEQQSDSNAVSAKLPNAALNQISTMPSFSTAIVSIKNKQNKKKKIKLGLFIAFGIMFIAWIMARPQDFNIVGYTHDLDYDPRGKSTDEVDAYKARFNGKQGELFASGLYFWTTTTSTIGYGDITPRSTWARMMCSLYQMFIWYVSVEAIIDIGAFKNIKSSNSDPSPRRLVPIVE